MIRRFLFLALLLLAAPAAAADSLSGSWALKAGGAIIMRFDLQPDGEGWKGGWTKPKSFASDGKRFGRITMPAVERQSDHGATVGGWAEITFDDPRPGEEPDVFRFHLIGPDRAEMLYVGTGLEPFVLERVSADSLLGPFEEGKTYGGAPAPAAVPSLQPRNLPPVQGPAVEGR